MATFKDLGEKYAEWLSEAKREDRGLIKKAEYLTESIASRSDTAETLKRIDADLKTYTIDKKPLSDSDRAKILEVTRVELGLPTFVKLDLLLKEASLDNFSNLVDQWDAFFDKLDD